MANLVSESTRAFEHVRRLFGLQLQYGLDWDAGRCGRS